MTEHYVAAFTVAALVGVISITFLFGSHATTRNIPKINHSEKPGFSRTKNRSQQAAVSVAKESDFPSDWLTSSEIFNLETRAIYCKSWIFVAHSSRFSKPGDYHSFSLSNYAIFLIMGKDRKIRAFHNVCRHRAYTVTRKESGSSTVLGCKYHGWSYNTQGHLVKAPMFDGVPGFKKEDNGLFEIEVTVSDCGAVWVNLHTGVKDQIINEEEKNIGGFLGLKKGKARWVDGRTVEGGFNWKKAANPSIFNIGQPDVSTSSVLSWFNNDPGETSALHVFPNSTMYNIPGTKLWYSVIVFPSSPNKSQVRYDIYSSSTKPETSIEASVATQIERMVSTQTKELEHSTSGQLFNTENKDFQNEILVRLKAHSKVERTLGREITPVLHKSRTSQKFHQAEILCNQLDCFSQKGTRKSATTDEVFAW